MAWNLQVPDAEYYTLSDPALDGIVREVYDQKRVAIDTETDGLDLIRCKPFYWSLSWTSQDGRDRRLTMPAETMRAFKNSFDDLDKNWIFANAKFDVHMCANKGVDIKGRLLDVSVMHALLYDEEPHGLKEMALSLLGWKWTDFSDTFGKVRKGMCRCGATQAAHEDKKGYCAKTGCGMFRQISPLDVLRKAEQENMGKLVDYAANDAYGTLKLADLLTKEMEETPILGHYDDEWPYIRTMKDYYVQTEIPFTRVLYTCERNGLKVDRKYLEGITPGILKDLEALKFEINRITGRVMKTSGPGLAKYFVEENGIRPFKMTKGGKSGVKKASVDSKLLQWIADDRAGTDVGNVARLLLEHEAIAKQYSTYIQKMPARLDTNDRVHMRLNQDIARTGRLSSSDPNMQNVTTGEKDRFHLRNAFIAELGYSMVVADYSQLEMRILAAASQEPAMMGIFHNNWDIHMGNASLVFDLPYDDIVLAKKVDKQVKEGKLPPTAMTKYVLQCLKARGDAKTIGFGLNYGMKEKAMAARMGCSVEEAIEKIEQYMAKYPAVQQFFNEAVESAREYGAAYTLLGRRRRLPNITASKDFIRFRAERQASNMPIQGTAAEACKLAMIHIYEDVELREKYGYRMCLQVHDEIVGECPTECVPEVKARIREWMEHPFPTDIGVPLIADIGSGPSWGSAK